MDPKSAAPSRHVVGRAPMAPKPARRRTASATRNAAANQAAPRAAEAPGCSSSRPPLEEIHSAVSPRHAPAANAAKRPTVTALTPASLCRGSGRLEPARFDPPALFPRRAGRNRLQLVVGPLLRHVD